MFNRLSKKSILNIQITHREMTVKELYFLLWFSLLLVFLSAGEAKAERKVLFSEDLEKGGGFTHWAAQGP